VYASLIVSVDAPGLRQPFTYRVPDSLPGLAPGACVVVPFGRQEALGYIVALDVALPDDLAPEAVKDILAAVTGDGAAIPDAVLKTARWMAREYLTDIATALRCVVPDAQAAHLTKRFALVSGWETALPDIQTPSHRQTVLTLAGFPDGAATLSELAQALGDIKPDSPVRLLRQRGLLTERYSVAPPRTGARMVQVARLTMVWDDAETAALAREARAPAQARLLRTLAASGGQLAVALLLAQSEASASALKKLESDGQVQLDTVSQRRKPYKLASGSVVPPVLTPEQSVAVDAVKARLDARQHHVALVYGVTGSGKTEVYLRAIAEARRRGRTALVLVPEIALTAQVLDSFRSRIGDRVAVLHSGLSDGERRDEWQRIGRGEADVVVGARSAVFAPLDNVGLIVVDEEHEGSYKQDQPAPRYHARDTAIARARATGATVLLGSATPSLETFYRASLGEYGFLPLRQRALSRPLPGVQLVDLREGYKKGKPAGLFAPPLLEAIADRLAKHEQIILFLNRRGFSMFLLCRDCGYTTRCPDCDVSLTFHQKSARIVCHHCGYERGAPAVCPSCGGQRLRPFGIGTEKVEEEVRTLFPEARALRMDRDTTARKDAHLRMLREFRSGEASILIGTQMVAKGLDFPGVTLVGVISADTALNIPDFRAAERAFQLLTQVSGRAGRGRKPGQVIVQTFNPEHESIAAAAGHDYDAFYAREIESRRELFYPPFSRLANIVAQDDDSGAPERRLRALAAALEGDGDLRVLGPAQCPLGRLRGKYRWHLLLKATDMETIRARLKHAMGRLTASERFGLSVDLDPMSLL
jgi:primosomal protein N' (replication factor Y)